MKIRSGFVSNSSSSSFVVRRDEWKQEGEKAIRVNILTKQQEEELEGWNFRKTVAHSPFQVPSFYDKKAWKEEAKFVKKSQDPLTTGWNWGYEVTCNQSEVMVFLIENKIPFVASCHYGHESYVYVPETDKLYRGTNYGSIMETYGPEGIEKRQGTGVVVFDGKEWVKKNKY